MKLQSKPVIGVTPSPSTLERSHGTFNLYGIADTYTKAIEAAGGIPVVLPPQTGNTHQLIGLIDGLLLSGGGDIDPTMYGDDDIHTHTYGVHPGRDTLEFELIQEAIKRDVPTLCICRGIQVLNVALGGTLFQDIADQYSEKTQHQQQRDKIAKEQPGHSVSVAPESLLATVYDTLTIEVNSFHHQAIKQLGADLVPIATAPDEIVEAVALPGHRWLLGVQWHPEMMFEAHEEHLKPFQGLVTASSAHVAAV